MDKAHKIKHYRRWTDEYEHNHEYFTAAELKAAQDAQSSQRWLGFPARLHTESWGAAIDRRLVRDERESPCKGEVIEVMTHARNGRRSNYKARVVHTRKDLIFCEPCD